MDPAVINPISSVEKIALALMLAIIMFGMGAGITMQDVWQSLRKPKGVSLGLFPNLVLCRSLPLASHSA